MRHIVLLALVSLLFSGCQHRFEEISSNPGGARPQLESQSTAYVPLPLDAMRKNKPIDNSGQITATIVRDALGRHVRQAYIGRRLESRSESLEAARRANCTYLVFATLLRWDDHATEYTAIRDKVEVKLEIHDVASGAVLDTVTLKGKSRVMTDGGDAPEDMLHEPIERYIASLFPKRAIPSAW
jgi:hypothetical protein